MAHTLDHIAAERQQALTGARWAGLGEFFAAEPVAWGQPFFGADSTPAPGTWGGAGGMPPETDTPGGPYGPAIDPTTFPFIGPFLGPLTPGYVAPVVIGTGGAERAAIAAELRAADAAQAAGAAERAAAAAGAAAEYVSDIPGEIGEAGGEFLSELGAGAGAGVQSLFEGFTIPLTEIPGDLFEGIPTWVPLLGAAFLLTRK